ncbi:AAA family ATPase [Burkholderiaceae bacterium FT117]|uniref:AAA family ATPase n=1 Tax=Zeimonas sediminis TaxID=2944268 RepID=UPI002342EE27|nr:AAA family ATPase [Zeimonas sediminis]MCM5572080.1 AAA family ATPase [Zeimonas sediminis]
MSLRILLLAPSSDRLSALSNALPQRGEATQIASRIGGAAELSAAILRDEVDIAVAELPVVSDTELSLIEATLSSHPRTTLILACGDSSSEFLLRAMRAGIREIVLPNSPPDALAKALERQLDRHAAVSGPARKARTIAFMSAKGGGGATFLATNLGFALAARNRKVALLDLNLQFGDASLFVSDQRASRNIADVAREIDRLDPAFLEANMMHPQAGYCVLAAPEAPERAVDVKAETIERIMAVARARYDFVLLDVGRVLDKVTVRALDEADTIYVVIQSTLPYLHNAKRLIGVLVGLGYDRDKVKVILNRYVKSDEIGVSEIEKTLGAKVEVQIPNSYAAVAYSINHGLSLLKHAPRDPVARSLSEIAMDFAPDAPRRTGWLRGVFGSSA